MQSVVKSKFGNKVEKILEINLLKLKT